MLDHVGCRLIFLSVVGNFFSRFVGSQLYFLPFVACRLTPFRPSLSPLFGLPRLISK